MTLAGFVLASCAPQLVQDFDRYLDAADACSRHRTVFVQSAKEWQAQIARWTAAGAITGAVAGAVLAKENRAAGALAGALLGGIGGAVIGYYTELQKRAADRDQLQAAINGDARSDLGRIRELKEAVIALDGCRRRQLEELRTALRSGTLTRAVGLERLEAIRQDIAEDNELIRIALGELGKRGRIYVAALDDAGVEDAERILERSKQYRPRVAEGSGRRVPPPAPAGATGKLYVATGLRLRSEPSTSSRILAVMPPGTEVEVVRNEGEWSYLRYGDREGYAATAYLATEPPGPASGSTAGGLYVDTSARPKASGDVERVAYETRELEALVDAHEESLERLADDIEALTVSERHRAPAARSSA